MLRVGGSERVTLHYTFQKMSAYCLVADSVGRSESKVLFFCNAENDEIEA